jgi:hypothetical protein
MFRRQREERQRLAAVRRLVADAEMHGSSWLYVSAVREAIGGIPVWPGRAAERLAGPRPDPLTGCLPVTADQQGLPEPPARR